MDPDDKKHVGKYSLGMWPRLGIAQAIMEDPDLLILDELMNGLDNQGVQHMRSLFIEIKERGKTILLASHFKEDIEYLCDECHRRVIIDPRLINGYHFKCISPMSAMAQMTRDTDRYGDTQYAFYFRNTVDSPIHPNHAKKR